MGIRGSSGSTCSSRPRVTTRSLGRPGTERTSPANDAAPGRVQVRNVAWASRPTAPALGAPLNGHLGRGVGFGVAAFPDGSSVVTGLFRYTMIFGETVLMTPGPSNASDVFVARYNADGSVAWAKRAGGGGTDLGAAITAFPDGSCVVTGFFEGTAVFGAGESNATRTYIGWRFRRLRRALPMPMGRLRGPSAHGGASQDVGWAIAALADGSSVVTGRFQSAAAFGAGESNETLLTAVGFRRVRCALQREWDARLGEERRRNGRRPGPGHRGAVRRFCRSNRRLPGRRECQIRTW